MNEESQAERNLRLSSTIRGVIIAALITMYAYLTRQPEGSMGIALLIAAGLQLAVIVIRRFVPDYLLPQVLYLFELLVDGATVLCFALGVFGGIAAFGRLA